MSEKKNYYVLAFYHIGKIEDPQNEVKNHKNFLKDLDCSARIYISEDGINGQMSAEESDAKLYIDWMSLDPRFKDMPFKIHHHHENVFPKVCVKYRRQLVAIDTLIDYGKRGKYLNPKEWREVLDSDDDYLLLDVRNDYEWELGHFEGAVKPEMSTFRDFTEYAKELKQQHKPEKKLLMYCTGGIRCELFSSLLKENGFENIFQLKGGVIDYGLKEGCKHWQGKLFVFDDRLSVDIAPEEKARVIGKCRHCKEKCETYLNCANVECNALFICCSNCLGKHLGSCSDECQNAPRKRSIQRENPYKPFRKWRT